MDEERANIIIEHLKSKEKLWRPVSIIIPLLIIVTSYGLFSYYNQNKEIFYMLCSFMIILITILVVFRHIKIISELIDYITSKKT